jgi:hypothetical protein
MAEPLTEREYEVGYSHYWYSGDFYWRPANPSTDDTWNNGTVYFRAGIYNIVTFSFEGMVWPVTSDNNYPGESFLNYTIGLGIISPQIEILIFDASLNIHYIENIYLDRSDQKDDKRFRDLMIGVPFRFSFHKNYAAWIAPVYVWNESEYYLAQTYSQSSNLIGVSFGADAIFFKHIYLNLNVQYTENLLPNIVAGYRF